MSRFVRIGRSVTKATASTSSVNDSLLNLANVIDSADPVYGTGLDGNVTISSNTTLTSDKYYNNLTLADGVQLNPGGYRIFVRNLLTMGTNSFIGYSTGFSTAGSIAQGGATATAVTHSLGGASATQTATAPTAALGGSQYYQQPLQAIRGWAVSASSTTPTFLRGGAGGASGAGGGVVIVSARYMTCNTGTYLKAPGTSGAGGGGGGVILVVSSSAVIHPNLSTDVTGGTGASAGTVNYMQVA
jgi:hypothetical protein